MSEDLRDESLSIRMIVQRRSSGMRWPRIAQGESFAQKRDVQGCRWLA
jgi:hypothetical protein